MTPLSRLLSIESDHVACFDRQNREIRWPDFLRSVAGVAARLAETDSRSWALDMSDSYAFACALFGCWRAGKTPVLAPRYMLERESISLDVDGVVALRAADVVGRPVIAFEETRPAEPSNDRISANADLILFTSGSTGQPTRVRRSIRHIEAELDVLESLWGERICDCRVYSSVSHRHVYGLLFRLLWPLVSRRAFATYDFEYPENLLEDVGANSVLVSSPALLKRLGHLSSDSPGDWRAVFSSGGLLPEYAAHDASRLLGCWPIEVLGSTETSGVAWRQQDRDGAASLWHVLSEVRVRQDSEGFLEVSSPFLGQSSWHRMGDKVRVKTERSFELCGRGDHVVKIEDKRVSLTEIEQQAIAHPWVTDAAAVALSDASRQYIGLVVQLSDQGQVVLQDQGRKEVNAKIRRSLRASLDPIALPKKYRYEDRIPVDSQGKRLRETMVQLFEAT